MGGNTKIPSGYRLVYAVKETHGSPIYGTAWSTNVHQVITKIRLDGGGNNNNNPPPQAKSDTDTETVTTPQDVNANEGTTSASFSSSNSNSSTVHETTTTTTTTETIDLTEAVDSPRSQEVTERSVPLTTVEEIDLTQDDDEEEGEDVPAPEPVPLTLAEKVKLTTAINGLSEEHMIQVANVIEASVQDLGDEDEVDVEMDTLDIVTQRKLQRMIQEVRRRIFLSFFVLLPGDTHDPILFLFSFKGNTLTSRKP